MLKSGMPRKVILVTQLKLTKYKTMSIIIIILVVLLILSVLQNKRCEEKYKATNNILLHMYEELKRARNLKK